MKLSCTGRAKSPGNTHCQPRFRAAHGQAPFCLHQLISHGIKTGDRLIKNVESLLKRFYTPYQYKADAKSKRERNINAGETVTHRAWLIADACVATAGTD